MLDVPTLMFAGGFVAAMCGALLLFTWWQHRDNFAPLWWAAGHFTLGVAVTILAVGFVAKAELLFVIGLTLLILAPALIWSGVRSFQGKQIRPFVVAGGVLAWVLAMASLGMNGLEWLAPVVNTLLAIAYNTAAAWELAKGNNERLKARVPLLALIGANIAVLSMAIPAALMGQIGDLKPPPIASLFGLIHFETIIYVIGTTLFFVAMMKERSELQQRHEAETDVLTRLPNRRAFLSSAERLAERATRDRKPFAAAAFDLDRFKTVNDTFGHAIGDRTLQVFADVVRESLRPGDLISRIGGEEFVAVLPGADQHIASLIAERVRRSFAKAGLVVEGRQLGVTVSVGVAVAGDGEPLNKLMERADAALYRAKLNGRDRVECDTMTPRAYPRLVEVA